MCIVGEGAGESLEPELMMRLQELVEQGWQNVQQAVRAGGVKVKSFSVLGLALTHPAHCLCTKHLSVAAGSSSAQPTPLLHAGSGTAVHLCCQP